MPLCAARLYRKRSQQCQSPDSGPHRSLTRSSRGGSHHFLRVRHISGAETPPGWPCYIIFHRCSHCSGISQYLQAHWCSDIDRIWVCYSPFGVCCPKRDIAKEMETSKSIVKITWSSEVGETGVNNAQWHKLR
jgi:hypothetical protein